MSTPFRMICRALGLEAADSGSTAGEYLISLDELSSLLRIRLFVCDRDCAQLCAVGFELAVAGRHAVVLKDERDDIDVGLTADCRRLVRRHARSNESVQVVDRPAGP